MPHWSSHKVTKPAKREPVVTATVLVPALVFLGSWLGFDLDEDTALAVAGVVAAIGGLIARHFVTPVAEPIDKPRPRRRRRNG